MRWQIDVHRGFIVKLNKFQAYRDKGALCSLLLELADLIRQEVWLCALRLLEEVRRSN